MVTPSKLSFHQIDFIKGIPAVQNIFVFSNIPWISYSIYSKIISSELWGKCLRTYLRIAGSEFQKSFIMESQGWNDFGDHNESWH